MKSGTVVTVLVVTVLLAAAVYGVATARPKTVPDPNAGLSDESYIERTLGCEVTTGVGPRGEPKIVLLFNVPTVGLNSTERSLRKLRSVCSGLRSGNDRLGIVVQNEHSPRDLDVLRVSGHPHPSAGRTSAPVSRSGND